MDLGIGVRLLKKNSKFSHIPRLCHERNFHDHRNSIEFPCISFYEMPNLQQIILIILIIDCGPQFVVGDRHLLTNNYRYSELWPGEVVWNRCDFIQLTHTFYFRQIPLFILCLKREARYLSFKKIPRFFLSGKTLHWRGLFNVLRGCVFKGSAACEQCEENELVKRCEGWMSGAVGYVEQTSVQNPLKLVGG